MNTKALSDQEKEKKEMNSPPKQEYEYDLIPDPEFEEDFDLDTDSESEEDAGPQKMKFHVDNNQSPIRIDKFIAGKLENVSRNKVHKSIEEGMILVNGGEVRPNYKIKPRDSITVFFQKPPGFDERYAAQDIPLDIIYEDEDLLVVNKPAGLVVHPGIGNYSGTLVNALLHYYQEKLHLPIKAEDFKDRPGIVHRIDKDTSGLLLIAKTEEAMSNLSTQFYHHSIQREYYALVWGDVQKDKGTIDEFIGRHHNRRLEQTVFPEKDEGRRAVTHYEVVERLYYVTLIKCRLETGRTHQIRVHMKYIGHTLFNDARYGGDKILKGTIYTKYRQFVENAFDLCPRQALHAKSLGFVQPKTGEKLYFESELPSDFQQCLDKWRKYVKNRVEGEE